MIFFAIVLFLLSGTFGIITKKSEEMQVFAYVFYSIAFSLIIATVYTVKVSFYAFPLSIDYWLCNVFGGFKLHVKEISRLYNLSFALLEVLSLVFLHKIMKISLNKIVPWVIPIIVMILYCDPYMSEGVFLSSYINDKSTRMIIYMDYFIKTVLYYFLLCYIFSPSVFLIFRIIKTKILIVKQKIAKMLVCTIITEAFIYFTFIKGAFSQILFINVNHAKIPLVSKTLSQYYLFVAAFFCVVVLGVFAVIYFFIYRKYMLVSHEKALSDESDLYTNLCSNIHTYKNAFIAIKKQMEIIELNINEKEFSDVEQHAAVCKKIAKEQIERTKGILEKFVGNHSVENDIVNIAECVLSATEITAADQGIQLIVNNPKKNISVFGNRKEIIEMFCNIIQNAENAVKHDKKENPYIKITVISEFGYVEVDVEDNGCGIEKENLRKIFKPFFSTKPRLEYGGLGLDYVKKIVNKHSGEIKITSSKGEYTLVKIMLPIC